jgi:hypothetical protein
MKTKMNTDGSLYTFQEALQHIKNLRPIINPTHKLSEDVKNHNI